MSEINKGLDLALFNQDGKHSAIMLIDFLQEKKVPHDVSILALIIALVAMSHGSGMGREDLIDVVGDIWKSYKNAGSHN